MPLVGSGCPGQRTTTSGLCRARKTSSSLEFQASSSVCINSALRSSVLIASPSLWRQPLEGKHVLGYLSSDEGNGDGARDAPASQWARTGATTRHDAKVSASERLGREWA